MGIFALSRLNHLIDNMPRSGLIGITHAEVDDILAPSSRRSLQIANNTENIRR